MKDFLLTVVFAAAAIVAVNCATKPIEEKEIAHNALDLLGDNFNPRLKIKSTYKGIDRSPLKTTANIKVYESTEQLDGGEVFGLAFVYDGPPGNPKNYIYLNPNYIDTNGYHRQLTWLHELGHAVFGLHHVSSLYKDRYLEDGCSKWIMDTFTEYSSRLNTCYDRNEDYYIEQFESWIVDYKKGR